MGRFSADVLETKKKELALCQSKYASAVSIVTTTVNQLKQLGAELACKIEELDQYEEDLKATRDDLRRVKEQNDKVAANFSALLGEGESHD